MRSLHRTTTISVFLLLALGAASIGYGLVHPDNWSLISGIIDLALCAVFAYRPGNNR